MNCRRIFLILAVWLSLAVIGAPATAQEAVPPPATEEELKLRQARQQLAEIQASLVEKRGQINEMRKQLESETDSVELEDLKKTIEREEADFSNLRRSFENIALGGVDLSGFTPEKQDEQINWQQELQLILKPLVQELKELTEKPRQIDRLNNRLAILENQYEATRRAVANLVQMRDDNLDKATQTRIEEMHKNWTRQLEDIRREREISQLQLNLLLDEKDSILTQMRQSMNEFFTGSGLNLALAIAAFFLTLFGLKGLHYLYTRLAGPRGTRSGTGRRILSYGYQAMTVVASVMAALMVLYVVGDILLLSLGVILVLLILLGLRNYLPRFINETKLLLNVGAVRERERVIYQGLPWMIRSLGMYSRLYNPALEGLLRVPMSEMLELVSRPFREDEPWFPTQVNDWVMMADGSIGQVVRQTPEIVELRTRGSIRTYTTTNFLAGEPRNLREGFGVSVNFGIDYQHQGISTTVVPKILRQAVEEALRRSGEWDQVEDILVEFQEAAASSLNYVVYVTMKGAAADSYFLLNRLLQRTCVDTCNEQGWVIPFNQLTLHLGSVSREAVKALAPQWSPELFPASRCAESVTQ